MPLYFTIPQYIQFGKATEFLMGNYEADGVIWGQRIIQKGSPVLVNIVTDALRGQYEGQPNDSTLEGVAQYLLFLCGMFQLQARSISGGGGSVIPVPGGIMPDPIEFVVNDTTSPIITGGSTLIIPQFRGFNLVFGRNDIIQSQVDNGGTYFRWNKVTGLFQCFGVAQLDDLFSLNPV